MPFKKRPVTVNAAIAPLLRAITDLENVADTRNEALARNSAEIGRLETQMQEDTAELDRAEAVAKAIKAITSPSGWTAPEPEPGDTR